MDMEIMQAEMAISEFIKTFIEVANNDEMTLTENEVGDLETMLRVAKTVHIAQLSIKKLVGLGEEDE